MNKYINKIISQYKDTNVLGYICLLPPIISVFLFVINVIISTYYLEDSFFGDIVTLNNLSMNWTGAFNYDHGGFSSTIPIYFGLMAISGALLLRNKKE